MNKKHKICILTTIGSSIKNWFEPVFDIYLNPKLDVTFISNFPDDYLDYLKNKYPAFKFINVNFPRGTRAKEMIKSFFCLLKIFKKEKFDLIEYHTPNASFCASIAGFFCRIKKRIYGQWGIRYVSLRGFRRSFFWFIEKLTCAFSTKVFAQSLRNVQVNIKKHTCNKKKLDIVGIGGTIGFNANIFDFSKKEHWNDEVRKELSISNDDFVFGFIGRIHKDKGVNELLEAFKHFPYGKLLLIGDIEKDYSIESYNLSFMKTSKSIIYLQSIDNSLVPKYLSCIDLFVYPTYREGFGHILQQAMAMGLPIITTNVPGPSEVVEAQKSGYLIEPRSSNAVLNAMKLLYKNTNILNSLSFEGRKRANTFFEMSVMVSNIKKNYEKLLGDKIYEQ